MERAEVVESGFTKGLTDLPYGLQVRDFRNALDALYDFFHAVNTALMGRGLEWMENLVRAAAVSNMVSDMASAAIAKHSNGLVLNRRHNGHPDLIPHGTYPDDKVEHGEEGVEVKGTRGRVADTHGARDNWVCQFNYKVDPEAIIAKRRPTIVTHIYLAHVTKELYRRNERKTELGTDTSTLDAAGMAVLRKGLIYQHPATPKG
ncbi:MAG: hypothetical protein K8R99_15510 [Actinomycetia bacterium]|nr:hypothetical protein [Actinomycetes bacterium]